MNENDSVMNEWRNERKKWIKERINKRSKKWEMKEWKKEWMNEKMYEWKRERLGCLNCKF